MDAERWVRLRELFDAAMELQASERPGFIARSCGEDYELRGNLESLLRHSLETGSDFDRAAKEAVDIESAIPTSLNLVGHTLDRYRIIEKIGEGGMGEVYRAADTRLGRDVAIKILPEDFTRDPERLVRFEREAQVLASLNHPNIATIFSLEEAEGVRFLVLELLEGETLRSKLERGPLPLNAVVDLAAQIAAGLAKAHDVGVVHRDLKPENLMVTKDGFVKILDFGLAKAVVESETASADLKTAIGRIMGTASYMSPEQARGEALDHRSDQFAFGSVLFEMTTGARAFAGGTDADTLIAIMRSKPQVPEDFEERLPGPLRTIIERSLAKQPEDRFESTRDLARTLLDLKALFPMNTGSAKTGMKRPQARRNRGPAAVGGLLAVGLAMVAVLWWQSREKTGTEAASEGGVSASIAVLPLENLGPPEQEYFADGMTDALITDLSKIKALKVISRRSVMGYKGSKKHLPEIAGELGVKTVLTGSVLHAGKRVRISAQLTEANTDRNLWAESYERDLDDILALQGEVARAIANAVEVKIDPEVAFRMVSTRTVAPDAHDAYVRGLAALEEGMVGSPALREILRDGVGNFQRAIEIEPDWAEPRAGLASAYRWWAGLGGPDEQAEFYPKAKAAALKAIELDDNVARAHVELGLVLLEHEWKWAEAEREIRRGLELDPNGLNWQYGWFLERAGRYDEAIVQYRKAMERDPISQIARGLLCHANLCAGHTEAAEAIAQHLIEEFPESSRGFQYLGSIYLKTSRFDEAVTAFENGRKVTETAPWLVQELPYALAKAGRIDEAREILRELEAGDLDWFPALYWVLGERDEAMAQIEAAFTVHRDVLLSIRCSPGYESFMENARFREIIDAIGFPN
jgi:TolB-like protein/tRNA A-37 threonylcarbamoyl transferase component Bud32